MLPAFIAHLVVRVTGLSNPLLTGNRRLDHQHHRRLLLIGVYVTREGPPWGVQSGEDSKHVKTTSRRVSCPCGKRDNVNNKIYKCVFVCARAVVCVTLCSCE